MASLVELPIELLYQICSYLDNLSNCKIALILKEMNRHLDAIMLISAICASDKPSDKLNYKLTQLMSDVDSKFIESESSRELLPLGSEYASTSDDLLIDEKNADEFLKLDIGKVKSVFALILNHKIDLEEKNVAKLLSNVKYLVVNHEDIVLNSTTQFPEVVYLDITRCDFDTSFTLGQFPKLKYLNINIQSIIPGGPIANNTIVLLYSNLKKKNSEKIDLLSAALRFTPITNHLALAIKYSLDDSNVRLPDVDKSTTHPVNRIRESFYGNFRDMCIQTLSIEPDIIRYVYNGSGMRIDLGDLPNCIHRLHFRSPMQYISVGRNKIRTLIVDVASGTDVKYSLYVGCFRKLKMLESRVEIMVDKLPNSLTELILHKEQDISELKLPNLRFLSTKNTPDTQPKEIGKKMFEQNPKLQMIRISLHGHKSPQIFFLDRI